MGLTVGITFFLHKDRHVVYLLRDPRSGAIRYVGQTVEPKNRLRSHLSLRSKTHKFMWIQQLKTAGLQPRLEVVEICESQAAANVAECEWIAALQLQGAQLTNTAPGGGGTRGFKMPAEARAAISRAKQGRPGHRHSAESRALISAGLTGRVCSERTRAQIAALNRSRAGVRLSDEHRAALSAALKGRLVSEETRLKMSAASKARVPGMLGKRHSPETKARMRAAWTLRKQRAL